MGAITKWSFLLFSSVFFVATLNAQYPATGNKQRLGWQTTGDGLVYRGAGAPSFTPTGMNNAWLYMDTDNGDLYGYVGGSWQLVGGGLSMPFDSVTFNVNEADALERTLKYSADKGYLQYGGTGGVQIPLLPGIWYVRNDDNVTVSKGMVVRASGTLGASGRIKVKRMIADGTIPAMYVLGIAMQDIAVGADGYVMTQGKIRQVNTTAYSEGAVLYADVDTLGGLTQTEPDNGYLKLPIAFVVHSASNGTLAVRIDPGSSLHDLHDVDTTGRVNGSVLQYNNTLKYWKASTTAGIVASDTSTFVRQYQLSGTSGYLPRYTTDTTMGNSPLYNQYNNRVSHGYAGYSPFFGIKNAYHLYGNGSTSDDQPMHFIEGNLDTFPTRAPQIRLLRSRATTPGASGGRVQFGDYLGYLSFWPNENVQYNQPSAYIAATLDSITGNADFPTSIRFAVAPNGSEGAVERVTINNAGRVGIGTTSPARTLHINATDAVRIPAGTVAQRGTGANGDIRFNSDSTVLEFYDGTGWRKPIVTNRGNGKGVANSFLKFDAAGFADTSAVLIQNGDKIGIGTASPDSTLTVSTGIRATNIAVRNALNQVSFFNNYGPANSDGNNIWIGNGGQKSIYDGAFSIFSGEGNVSIGAFALFNNEKGHGNMAIGLSALSGNVNGSVNVAIGGASLSANQNGVGNMAIGALTLQNGTSGSENVAIGYAALNSLTGSNNVAIGSAAQYSKTSGNSDIAIGRNAGRYQTVIFGATVTNSSESIYIGADAYPGKNNATNMIVIGTGAVGNGDNTTTIGRSTTQATYIPAGKLRIGNTTAPTATLHLPAGTASANTAPLKFTSGTNLTTPEAGAVEWNGTNLFVTNSSASRRTVNQGISSTLLLNFAAAGGQSSSDQKIALTGVEDGDVVSLGVPNAAVFDSTCYTAWAFKTDSIIIRFNNYSRTSKDPAQATFKVFVTKFNLMKHLIVLLLMFLQPLFVNAQELVKDSVWLTREAYETTDTNGRSTGLNWTFIRNTYFEFDDLSGRLDKLPIGDTVQARSALLGWQVDLVRQHSYHAVQAMKKAQVVADWQQVNAAMKANGLGGLDEAMQAAFEGQLIGDAHVKIGTAAFVPADVVKNAAGNLRLLFGNAGYRLLPYADTMLRIVGYPATGQNTDLYKVREWVYRDMNNTFTLRLK